MIIWVKESRSRTAFPFPNLVREQTCDSQQIWFPWVSTGHVATLLHKGTKRGDPLIDKKLNKYRKDWVGTKDRFPRGWILPMASQRTC